MSTRMIIFESSVVVLALLATQTRADGSSDDVVPTWVEDGGWIILVLACLAMFYGLATVVEEFFVPALNTFCTKYKIPDDVAGATFMAAAASSPEMFAAFISLFVTHTALGVGTILGSELFNHLMITAGSIYYSKGGTIKCDWRLVGREAFFYFLAMALLFWCLLETSDSSDSCQGFLDNAPLTGPAGDPNYGSKLADLKESGCICVYWYHAVVLVLGYLSYALTCAYYQKLMASFCPGTGQSPAAVEDDWKKTAQNGFEDPGESGLQSSQSVFSQPLENFQSESSTGANDSKAATDTMENPMGAPQGMTTMSVTDTEAGMNGSSGKSPSTRSRGFTTVLRESIVHNLTPPHIAEGANAGLNEVVIEGSDSFSCYMWKKSQYYSKLPNHPKAWPLRWCTIDANGFRSSRTRGSKEGTKAMDIFNTFAVDIVDDRRFLLKISTPRGTTLFQAPSADILSQLHLRLTSKMNEYKAMPTAARKAMRQASLANPFEVDVQYFASMNEPVKEGFQDDADDHDGEDHGDMLAWPTSNAWVPWHLLVLPVKIILHYTVADVRKPGDEHKYIQSMLMSVFYLAMFSFVMTESMGLLGPLIGIDDFIMGIVFAAAGTSFPNVFASMVVARQGMGNAAISNALGGNVFNIFIGLGLPWIFYIIIPGSEYVDYDNYVYYGLSKGGILFPLLLLVIVLVAFIALLLSTGWNLYTSHAHTAVFLYGCFLIYVFTTQLKVPALG